MTTMSISDQIMPLRLFQSFAAKAKETSSQRKLNRGMKKILEGLSLVCEASISAFDGLIEKTMKTEQSQCTPEEYRELVQVIESITPFLSEMMINGEFPEEQKQLIATFVERLTIFENLERQMHEGAIMQTSIDINALNMAVKTGSKGNLLEWVEA